LKKKYVFLLIGLLIIIIIGVIIARCISYNNTPQGIIEKKLELKLPATSSIIDYYYNDQSGYIAAKILIDEDSISDIESQLILTKVDSEYIDNCMPNFRNVTAWWDMKREDILLAYAGFMPHKHGFGKVSYNEAWVFVVKDYEGLYYFYIAY